MADAVSKAWPLISCADEELAWVILVNISAALHNHLFHCFTVYETRVNSHRSVSDSWFSTEKTSVQVSLRTRLRSQTNPSFHTISSLFFFNLISTFSLHTFFPFCILLSSSSLFPSSYLQKTEFLSQKTKKHIIVWNRLKAPQNRAGGDLEL